MLTSSLDHQEIQLLLVALRYWRLHRSEGVSRRTDPHISPERMELLVAKLTSSVPPSERDPRQRTLFAASGELASQSDDATAGPGRREKPGSVGR